MLAVSDPIMETAEMVSLFSLLYFKTSAVKISALTQAIHFFRLTR